MDCVRDNKMTPKQHIVIIEIIQRCFLGMSVAHEWSCEQSFENEVDVELR